jgi:outer membrane protein
MQSRETIRLVEQNILSSAATSYMNVLRDTAILNLRRNNTEVLEQQLRQTRDRFQVGEVTRTDVAQAEASLAQGQADAFTAQSNLQTSIANYRQIVGVEPRNLQPARPLEKLLPRSLDAALSSSLTEHPAIQAALHNVDTAALNVKVIEGQLYPTVGVTGSVSRRYDAINNPDSRTLSASVVGSLSVPIYEGGAVYAGIRQAKELLGQARLQADLQREQIRAQVVSSWGIWLNSRSVIDAAQAQVRAAEIALNGVREEAKVGQRTTLDVLNAQQLLLNARVQLVTAQRDRVVGSYAVLAAIGRLSASRLGLGVVAYDPTVHYDQVKGKWIGTRTPDGR